MKKTKTQKGITLITLITTIVVLIVLAFVSISAIKNNNIISYTNNAAQEFEDKQELQNGSLQDFKDFLNNEMSEDSGTLSCEHVWNSGVTIKYANCTENGRILYTCTSCGATKEASSTKLGHSYIKYSTDSKYLKTDATCISPAIYYLICSRCGAYGSGGTISIGDALGHNYINKVDSKYLISSATTASAAKYYKSCSRCGTYGSGGTFYYGSPLSSGNTIGGNTTGDYSHNHSNYDYSYVYYAGTSRQHIKYKKCSDCGSTYGDPINEYHYFDGRDASTHYYCKCGERLEEWEEYAKKGSSYMQAVYSWTTPTSAYNGWWKNH